MTFSLPRSRTSAITAAVGAKPKVAINQYFRHWLALDGTTQVVRQLPPHPAMGDNPFLEKRTSRMPFTGILGVHDEPMVALFVSPSHFGFRDPGVEATRPMWRGNEDARAQARLYYWSSTYLGNALVLTTTIKDELETPPANPVRITDYSRALYLEYFQPELMDAQSEYVFTDPVEGYDHQLRKVRSGQFSSYSVKFLKPRALTEEQVAAVEQWGLWDLSQELGPTPTTDDIKLLEAMLEDSFDGKPFDMEQYGRYPGLRLVETRKAPQQATAAAPNSNGNGATRAARLQSMREPEPSDEDREATRQTLQTLRNKVTATTVA